MTETHAVSREAGARYLILLAAGVVVTLIVCAALGLLVYGAILDGRYAEERKAEEALQPSPRAVTGHRPAA